MQKYLIILLLVFGLRLPLIAQFVVVVQDAGNQDYLTEVSILDTTKHLGFRTHEKGIAQLKNVARTDQFLATYLGFEPLFFTLTPKNDTTYISLTPVVKEEHELVISSTRTDARISNVPIKIEVLGLEEMADENTIKPGNIASLIGDFSGIQVQQLSAVNGNSSVRFFGLDGKYSLMLHDGLPIYQGLSSSFGILQIPPLDLQQIELIKGPSSTLYGGGAVSGLLNLVSKTPGMEAEKTMTISQSSLGETNINAYLSKSIQRFGYTLFAGVNHQFMKDVDKDGFSDVPYLRNLILHPKVFYTFNRKTKANLGYTLINETRKGGDLLAYHSSTDPLHQYLETNKNFRQIIDVNLTHSLNDHQQIEFKGGVNFLNLEQKNNRYAIRGRTWNEASEVNYSYKKNRHHWIAGINYYSNGFTNSNKMDSTVPSTQQQTLGLYTQYNYKLRNRLTYQIGGRLDRNMDYGWYFLPAAALLLNWNTSFTTRINIGKGYKTPDVFNYNGIGLDGTSVRLHPNTVAEKSIGGNIDLSYNHTYHQVLGIKFNSSFFYNQIEQPMYGTLLSAQQFEFSNAGSPIITQGIDNYLRLTYEDIEVYLGYTYVHAKKTYDSLQPFIELTPKHKLATTITYEIEHRWRFGIEAAYTGRQYLSDGSKTKSYLFFAAMIKREFKHISLVLNGENLLNFKQTTYEKVVTNGLPLPTFKPLWAPIDGRNINLTFLIKL